MTSHRGFSLIELMIAIAIIAIIAAVAIPAYQGYLRESRLGAMRLNLDSLRIAVEATRLDSTTGTYGSGTYSTLADLLTQYGWKPEGDGGGYAYTVSAASTAYWIRATDASGLYARCDKTATTFKCCGAKGTGATACP